MDSLLMKCTEINLKKQVWIIISIYHPPNMNDSYFIDHLSKTIDFYSTKYDRLIIMGDFNLEPSAEPIETLCDSYDLYNLVKEDTCFKGEPKCYDLILTNCKHNFQNTMALTTGFSDFHKMTATVLKTEYVKADPIQVNYRDYKHYNPRLFREELRNNLNSDTQSTTNYNNFQNILCNVLNKHAPMKKKYLRANDSPFMTKHLRKMIMNRSRCKNAYTKSKTVENWEKYRKIRNECVKITKKAKKDYFQNINIKSVNDNKKFWKTIKPNFSNKNKTQKIILVENGEILSENVKIAEVFNDYFINIVKDLNIPEIIEGKTSDNPIITNTDDIESIIRKYGEHPSILKIREHINHTETFTFMNVNEMQIETEIYNINSKKAPGVDGIPGNILKESVDIWRQPLKQLYNISIEKQQFPSKLKYANVTPLFKKDENIDKTNYRPISILTSISKIFERLMFKQITHFVESKISQYLCGFRKGYNTQHALLRLIDKLNKSVDKTEKIGIFMMDLSKAFDCIPHDLLIAKLNAYGFDKASLKLIHSYLNGRKQRVKINSEYSTWKDIISGVPQGSVLGPLLFNIFINDLFLFVVNSDICNFADDNTLSVADLSIEQIITLLEHDINILLKWFRNNGMLLNETKCQFLTIESSRCKRDKPSEIKVHGKTVVESKEGKLLGITIDNNITMKKHIKNICKQAGNKLNALARIAKYLDENKRKLLMNSFIISQFNYCPIVWMYCQRQSNNLINKIHERALRIAYNDYTLNFQGLLEKDNSVSIHQRNIETLAIEIFKTKNELNPNFMKDIFRSSDHNYCTRNQNLAYPNPKTVTYGVDSFGYKANQVWNSLSNDTKSAENLKTFKTLLSKNKSNLCTCNLCKMYIPNVGYI